MAVLTHETQAEAMEETIADRAAVWRGKDSQNDAIVLSNGWMDTYTRGGKAREQIVLSFIRSQVREMRRSSQALALLEAARHPRRSRVAEVAVSGFGLGYQKYAMPLLSLQYEKGSPSWL